MHESPAFHFHLEWPAAGAVVGGPVVWLRGWLVGRDGHDFTDLRVRVGPEVHLGLLGLPRADLAAHFKAEQPWLPAAFVVGVPLPDGPAELRIEALDACGAWHELPPLNLRVEPGAAASPQAEGTITLRPGGSWTGRGAHQPFEGELGEPVAFPAEACGRLEAFGWLVHQTQSLRAMFATCDLLVFNHLAHSLVDDAPGAVPRARQAWWKGPVDAPPTLTSPACLRVYAQLADGAVHLCFATRIEPPPAQHLAAPLSPPIEALPAIVHPTLAARPSGRPRRLLLVTPHLQADESTWRALEAGRHLTAGAAWAARLVTAADGPLRAAFEAAGIAVQVLDLSPLFAARDSGAVETALAAVDRAIWWGGLDAVAVFDPSSFGIMRLARRHGLPVLFDGAADDAFAPPPGVSPAVAAAMVAAWRAVDRVSYASTAAPARHAALLGGSAGSVVPTWNGAPASQPSAEPKFVVAPVGGAPRHGAAVLLRAADWLARRAVTLPWRIAVTEVRDTDADRWFVADAVLNRPGIMAVERVTLASAAACVCPAFSAHPIHALLEAALAGVPIITTGSPAIAAHFSAHEALLVPAGNALALAHALADLAANPDGAARRAHRARARTLAGAAAAASRWQAALEALPLG